MSGDTWPVFGEASDSNAVSTAALLVSAICWPASSAVTKAFSVFGLALAQAFVTTYPSIGNCVVAPWLRSAMAPAPFFSSIGVANGAGPVPALPALLWYGPALSPPAIAGN